MRTAPFEIGVETSLDVVIQQLNYNWIKSWISHVYLFRRLLMKVSARSKNRRRFWKFHLQFQIPLKPNHFSLNAKVQISQETLLNNYWLGMIKIRVMKIRNEQQGYKKKSFVIHRTLRLCIRKLFSQHFCAEKFPSRHGEKLCCFAWLFFCCIYERRKTFQHLFRKKTFLPFRGISLELFICYCSCSRSKKLLTLRANRAFWHVIIFLPFDRKWV